MSRILYRILVAAAFAAMLAGLSGCMRETLLDVVVDFDYTIERPTQGASRQSGTEQSEPVHTAPLTISLDNRTTGADTFEWTFEGGDPATSSDKNPPRVTFTAPGEHRITLTARNKDRQDSRQLFVRVDEAVTAAFDTRVLVNDFAPAQVQISNLTKGAGSYRWTFEGGDPATSNLEHPGTVLFREAGEHKITLKVSNGSESFTTERTITLAPPLECSFTMTPAAVSVDMEAPLTAIVKNTSRSSLHVLWESPEGVIANKSAEETTIRFDRPGTYTVTLTADNLKERKSTSQQITVKPSRGIYKLNDLRFGISQAKNTIGCFLSVGEMRVLKSSEITSAKIGGAIEIGFFALNSSFDHCYFFSPDKAAESGFAAIPGAAATQVNNTSGNAITSESFGAIETGADLDAFSFAPYTPSAGDQGDAFALRSLPVFSFFVTHDGRRGVAMIKNVVRNGKESYMVADIKIEK